MYCFLYVEHYTSNVRLSINVFFGSSTQDPPHFLASEFLSILYVVPFRKNKVFFLLAFIKFISLMYLSYLDNVINRTNSLFSLFRSEFCPCQVVINLFYYFVIYLCISINVCGICIHMWMKSASFIEEKINETNLVWSNRNLLWEWGRV